MDTLPDMLSEITGAKLYAEFASKMFDEMLVNNLRDDDKLFDRTYRTYRSRLAYVRETAEFVSKMFKEMIVKNLRYDDSLFDRTYRSRLSHVQEDEYWEKYDNLKQPISEKA